MDIFQPVWNNLKSYIQLLDSELRKKLKLETKNRV